MRDETSGHRPKGRLAAAAAAAGLLAAGATPAPGQVCPPEELFAPAEFVPLTAGPASLIESADLDGDGVVELVIFVRNRAEAFIHRLDGAGGIDPEAIIVPLAAPLRDGQLADIDADGDLDIVSVSVAPNRVDVALNDGVGGFRLGVGGAISAEPSGLFDVADIDGDGLADVLIQLPDNGSPVPILSGDGRGGFIESDAIPGVEPRRPTSSVVLETGPESIIAVSRLGFPVFLGPNIEFWRRLPGGGFEEMRSEVPAADSLSLVDLEGDGEQELVGRRSTPIEPYPLIVYRRNGGGWDEFQEFPFESGGVQPVDLDGDLDLDLVVSRDGEVEVQWAAGPGLYVGSALWSTAGGRLVVLDLDEDGDQDIIRVDGDRLAIVRGRSDGSFAATGRVRILWAVSSADPAFFDFDDVPGLEWAVPHNGGLHILTWRAAEGRRPAIIASIDLPGARAVRSIDLDGDGDVDLVANDFNEVFFIERTGPLSFEVAASAPYPGVVDDLERAPSGGDPSLAPSLVVTGSEGLMPVWFEDDGSLVPGPIRPLDGRAFHLYSGDVVGGPERELIAIFKPDGGDARAEMYGIAGDGSLELVGTQRFGSGSTAVTVADLDNDGRPELLRIAGQRIEIHVADGRGGLPLVRTIEIPQHTFGTSDRLPIGDFDGDGIIDLIIPDTEFEGGLTNAFLRGLGDIAFEAPVLLPIAERLSSGWGRDVTGDGVLDLVGAASRHSWQVYANQCTFAPPIPVPAAGVAAQLDTGDLTGDGDPEIVAALPDQGGLQVFVNQLGASDPIAPWLTLAPQAAGERPVAVALGDLDGDGWLDAVVADDAAAEGADGLRVFLNAADGSGVFIAPDEPLALAPGLVVDPRDVAVADFDGDGVRDIVVANAGRSDGARGGSVVVLRNGGDGFAFTVLAELATARGAGVLDPCDIDDDKDLDLAVAVAGTRSLAFFVNRGPGDPGFDPGPVVAIDGEPVGLAGGDFDSDGRADLVTANLDTGTLTIVRSTGPGTFEVLTNLGFGESSVAVVAADFNQDGGDDLAAITEVPGLGAAIRVRLRTSPEPGNTSFEPPVDLVLDVDPVFLATADFDVDAFPDLATANDVDGGASPGPGAAGEGDGGPATEAISVLLNDGASSLLACQADVDGDGAVGFADLILVLSSWGQCFGFGCPADIDGDSFVGTGDLLRVIDAWGEDCGS